MLNPISAHAPDMLDRQADVENTVLFGNMLAGEPKTFSHDAYVESMKALCAALKDKHPHLRSVIDKTLSVALNYAKQQDPTLYVVSSHPQVNDGGKR